MRAAIVITLAIAVTGCKKEATSKQPPVPHQASPSPERLAAGERALAQDCGICHSQDLVLSQRLTQAQWEKEVKKMAGWGAPLPPEDAGPLVELLLARAGTDVPPTEPARMTVADAVAQLQPDATPIAGDRKRGEAAYRTACASCHGEGGVGGSGPALIGRTVLLRAVDFLAVVASGRERMPAFATSVDARDVLAYLRAL